MTRVLTIATWNINSIRLRFPLLSLLDHTARPDIICLQEIKVADASFPLGDCHALGYPYVAFKGEKGYNGVAILSRIPFLKSHSEQLTDIIQSRHIMVELENGVEIHNFYVPAGGDVPDPKVNPKFDHKLRYVKEATAYMKKQSRAVRMILVGDLNIAPLPDDVWSHKQLLTVVSHTPQEVVAMEAWSKSIGFVDVHRHFYPVPERCYSWWSYRNLDWRKSDRGRRLDHIWVTPNLSSHLVSSVILKDARDWANPSDHVPVITKIRL